MLIAFTLVATVFVFLFLRDDQGTRANPDEVTGVETFAWLLRGRAILALAVFRFSFSFGKMAVIIFFPV